MRHGPRLTGRLPLIARDADAAPGACDSPALGRGARFSPPAQPVSARNSPIFLPHDADPAGDGGGGEAYAARGVNLVQVAGGWQVPHGAGCRPRFAQNRRGAAPAAARGDGDAGDHRLSPAGHAHRDRGDPRRGFVAEHAGPAAGERAGDAEGP